jgi:hypothetical protein
MRSESDLFQRALAKSEVIFAAVTDRRYRAFKLVSLSRASNREK